MSDNVHHSFSGVASEEKFRIDVLMKKLASRIKLYTGNINRDIQDIEKNRKNLIVANPTRQTNNPLEQLSLTSTAYTVLAKLQEAGEEYIELNPNLEMETQILSKVDQYDVFENLQTSLGGNVGQLANTYKQKLDLG